MVTWDIKSARNPPGWPCSVRDVCSDNSPELSGDLCLVRDLLELWDCQGACWTIIPASPEQSSSTVRMFPGWLFVWMLLGGFPDSDTSHGERSRAVFWEHSLAHLRHRSHRAQRIMWNVTPATKPTITFLRVIRNVAGLVSLVLTVFVGPGMLIKGEGADHFGNSSIS